MRVMGPKELPQCVQERGPFRAWFSLLMACGQNAKTDSSMRESAGSQLWIENEN
jgi:hypothetical protein